MPIKLFDIFKYIIWPLSRPPDDDAQAHRIWWKVVCIASVVPLAAIYHHALFYRPTCMMNNFGADYYIPSVLFQWLSRDPSLPWAIVSALVIYSLGNRYPGVKVFVSPLFISFLPLSIWVWDIPCAGRPVCHNFHDNRSIFPGYPMRAIYLYVLGAIVYGAFLAYIGLKKK